MRLLLGEALFLLGVAAAAVVVARPAPLSRALVVGAVPVVVGLMILRTVSVGAVLTTVLVLTNLIVLVLALLTGQVLGAHRRVAHALHQGLEPVSELLPELEQLCAVAGLLGFEPVPGGAVWLGDTQLVVAVRGDGIRAELVQTPGRPPGYAFATHLTDGSRVTSVPWGHGLEEDRIRVPGATIDELLVHHVRGVEARTSDGARPLPAHPERALDEAVDSDRLEALDVLARPWANAFRIAVAQTPLRPLVGR